MDLIEHLQGTCVYIYIEREREQNKGRYVDILMMNPEKVNSLTNNDLVYKSLTLTLYVMRSMIEFVGQKLQNLWHGQFQCILINRYC